MNRLLLIVLMMLSLKAQAVHVNPDGLGEVLLLPYYSVNNNLNSLITLNNHSDQGKAIKVNIRESHNGYAGMSLNVYLAPFDSWTFGVYPVQSSVPEFYGAPTAQLYTTDHSCSSLDSEQPTELDHRALVDGSPTLQRFTEGFIEILEMGVVTGESLEHITHTAGGVPQNCAAIEANWLSEGMWHGPTGGNAEQDLQPPAGQLSAELNLIDVAQGLNFSLQATALADFYPANHIPHVSPADDSLSLDAAHTTAWVMLGGVPVSLLFERGIDAISGLLMTSRYIINYDINPAIKAQTELVISFPTRRFYLREDAIGMDPPFEAQSIGEEPNAAYYGMNEMGLIMMSREAESGVQYCGGHGGCPIRPQYDVAGSVGVVVFRETNSQAPPEITGGHNAVINREIPFHRADDQPGYEGVVLGDLAGDRNRPFTATRIDNSVQLKLFGLPAMGVMLQTYSNGNAKPGLLAQYGGIQPVRTEPLNASEIE